MTECDCCDIPFENVYNKVGEIIDFKCTNCGKLESENVKDVICCVEGFNLKGAE